MENQFHSIQFLAPISNICAESNFVDAIPVNVHLKLNSMLQWEFNQKIAFTEWSPPLCSCAGGAACQFRDKFNEKCNGNILRLSGIICASLSTTICGSQTAIK
jgi:hypothetical protein